MTPKHPVLHSEPTSSFRSPLPSRLVKHRSASNSHNAPIASARRNVIMLPTMQEHHPLPKQRNQMNSGGRNVGNWQVGASYESYTTPIRDGNAGGNWQVGASYDSYTTPIRDGNSGGG